MVAPNPASLIKKPRILSGWATLCSTPMVAPNPASLIKNPRILSGWATLCSTPITQFNAKSRILMRHPVHMKTSFASYRNQISIGPANVFRNVGRAEFGSGHRSIRVSSGGGGGGGIGGSGDGWSGGGDGSSGGGDNGSNWSLLSWYLSLLAKHPVITKAVTSAILTLVGDLICQILIDRVESLDLRRTFTFTLLGLVLVGPTLHFWYLYLSKLVTASGASGAILRLILDQFVFAPIFIGTFLSTLVTLEGKPSLVIPKLQQEWFSSVLANWQLWIPFQFLNFRFVPQQFQVLAANFIALVWNVILSYKAHKEVVAK